MDLASRRNAVWKDSEAFAESRAVRTLREALQPILKAGELGPGSEGARERSAKVRGSRRVCDDAEAAARVEEAADGPLQVLGPQGTPVAS